ncbi:hypothetical protein Tco_1530366, partial [Tanacetum coccineum]
MRRLRRNHIYGCTVTSIMERNLDQVRVTDYGKRIGVTWQPGNVKIKPDIENMTMNEYLEYEATKERQLWDDVRSRRSPTNYNEADVDSFHRNKSKTFSYPYSHNLAPSHPCFLPVQPYLKNYLVSTNEGNDVDIETPATKSILDELLEEFRDEILNVTMVDDEADINPTKDLEELEILLAKEPQSNFEKIQVHSVIINTEPFIHTQLMSPLYGVFKTSKPCKVDKDIISPG